MAETIITGCELVDLDSNRWVHGDLWEEGDCWIFNACLREGETDWTYDTPDLIHCKCLLVIAMNFFERRGVIVVDKAQAALNPKAQEYVAS